MKVLFDHPNPFLLAHGGLQIQIERTMAALEKIGVEVEFLRWWDERQRGDLIHFFGRAPSAYIELAHKKGLRVVMLELLTGLGSRPSFARLAQKSLMWAAGALLPAAFLERLAWRSYQLADACIANTDFEAELMVKLFSAPSEKVYCVPNGVEEIFLHSVRIPRGPWLVCTGTITERKRMVELAQAAVLARTPLKIVGKPYSNSDPYAGQFQQLVKEHPDYLRHEGAISDRQQLAGTYREARGFVLLSVMETRSLAAEEAAACECPLLLSDLPWARSVFGAEASYCPIASPQSTARTLRHFYDQAGILKPPPKPLTWTEVAGRFKAVYERVLNTSR